MNGKETIYSSGHILGVEEVTNDHKIREISFLALLKECECLPKLKQEEINAIQNIAVVWYGGGFEGEVNINEIYNHDTGEVYWEHNDLPQNRMWTDADEKLISSILMWGELESTIGGKQ